MALLKPKLFVAGHMTVDTIVINEVEFTSLGGPPCYAGLTAKNLGADVTIITRVGYEFPDEYVVWVARAGLDLCKGFRSREKPTTRFLIIYEEGKRRLILKSKCDDLDPSQLPSHQEYGVIINPVANEVSKEFLNLCSEKFELRFLDPQGFLRGFSEDGSCFLHGMDMNLLRAVDFIKMDEEEAYHITGRGSPIEALEIVHKLGIKGAIMTRPQGAIFSNGIHVYQIRKRNGRVSDTTGRGDVFGGAFFVTYLKERDFTWSVCVGLAASSLCKDKLALSKIPTKEDVLLLAEELKENVAKVYGP